VHEPPAGVSPADVLAATRAGWAVDAETAQHLPVGFGAHHWRVGPLFVTLDALGARHDATSLEAAYAGAAALALPFVVAPIPSVSGAYTVPFAEGALSVTPWIDGTRPPDASVAVPLVEELQTVEPPRGLRRWSPLVPDTLAEDLARLVERPWDAGPHGTDARRLLAAHLGDIAAWTARYHGLAEVARSRPWVASHGEPHERNLLLTHAGPRLVDWESLQLAPAERDLRVLGRPGDPGLIELFDVEWRLDEIAQYASWFSGPHGDTADDRTALGGLADELERG